MAVLGALPHYYLFGATFLAAVSLQLSFYGDGVRGERMSND